MNALVGGGRLYRTCFDPGLLAALLRFFPVRWVPMSGTLNGYVCGVISSGIAPQKLTRYKLMTLLSFEMVLSESLNYITMTMFAYNYNWSFAWTNVDKWTIDSIMNHHYHCIINIIHFLVWTLSEVQESSVAYKISKVQEPPVAYKIYLWHHGKVFFPVHSR